MADPVVLCIEKFVAVEHDFMQALKEVFPECNALHRAKLKFDMACKLPGQKKQRVEEWLQYMTPLKRAIADRDAAVVIKDANFPPTVQEIQIEEKWNDPDIDDETRSAIFDYLQELMQISDMYSLYTSVPTGMMSSLTSMAEEIAEDMKQGRMDMSQLDLAGLSQQISSRIDPNDLNAFAEGVDPSIVQNMLGNMMMPPQQ